MDVQLEAGDNRFEAVQKKIKGFPYRATNPQPLAGSG